MTYSQIGSRGLPWTSVKSASDRRCGQRRQPGPRRARDGRPGPLHGRPGLRVEPVDLDRADGRGVVVAADADRARARPAGRRRRPAPGRSRRRHRGARWRRPTPTWASTASRATRLLWMSERTAIRTRTESSSAPLTTAVASARAGIARVARPGRGRAPWRRPADARRARRRRPSLDLERAAAERGDRPVRGGQLGREVAALPGDEAAARCEQREGQLDELGQGRDGARRDRRPAPAMAGVGGERLRPDRRGLDRVRRARSPRRRRRQEAGLLGDRLEEQRPRGRAAPRRAGGPGSRRPTRGR